MSRRGGGEWVQWLLPVFDFHTSTYSLVKHVRVKGFTSHSVCYVQTATITKYLSDLLTTGQKEILPMIKTCARPMFLFFDPTKIRGGLHVWLLFNTLGVSRLFGTEE